SGARVRHLRDLSRAGRNEAEGVAADVHVGDGLFDARHVARDALAAGAPGLMVRVLFEGRSTRAVGRAGAMAFEADGVRRLDEVGRIGRAVDVVATEAGHAAGIHHAADEIVALHAVLVGGAVGEVGEAGFARLVLLETPELLEVETGAVA